MHNYNNMMKVIKRNGKKEQVSFDKITKRLVLLSQDFEKLDPISITQKVIYQIYDGVHTSEIDELAARLCYSLITDDSDYGTLASRIIISNNHKNTSPSFSESMSILYNNIDKNQVHCPLIAEDVYNIIMNNKEKLNNIIDYNRDYKFDYFAYKTLEKSYLLKINKKVIERIQHMFMRVSIGIHKEDINSAIESYNLMSQKYFIHATPTLYHAGTPSSELLSCFLLGTHDSIDGMYQTIKNCAMISKGAGGIGIHISNIRSKGSFIRGTNGYSDGIIPMLQTYNATAKHVNQGGGKRPGAFAIYIEPHHPDVLDFLELKKNHGDEELRARDLFLAVWVSDLFMNKVEKDDDWCLMDPDECPGLTDVYGEKYEELYYKYELEKKYRTKIKARDVWKKILDSQIETGVPYITYKDSVNKKSNQKNYGVIKSSNLCVSGDTKILTSDGYKTIELLKDQTVTIWNGYEFSKTIVKQTGKNQSMLNIFFSNGMQLKCTPYHVFYINLNNTKTKIKAEELEIGMKLIDHLYPIIYDGDTNFVLPYIYGYWSFENNNKQEKIPFNYNLDIKLKWFAGLCDSIAYINDEKSQLEIYDFNLIYLQNILLMLQTININSIVTKEGNTYILSLKFTEIKKLISLGFKLFKIDINKLHLNDIDNDNYTNDYIYITKIEQLHDKMDTYCFNEPLKHTGIFNGIITGQCNEIVEYSDEKEFACCTLASISLPSFVEAGNKYNYSKLIEVVKIAIKNLNKIIDVNKYPVPETKLSNHRHRPLGLGVQGLADVFLKMRFPFESSQARELNKNIFETMYYAAMTQSCELAKQYGPYETFKGSPLSQGLFQFDLWNVVPSDKYDWQTLRENVITYGVRNSLLIALMPTASTSQILSNTECFEPITSNFYVRRTQAGEFKLVNKYLIDDLISLGIWNKELKDTIIANRGSVQNIEGLPNELKELYKTVWEIKQKSIMDLAIDRAPYICQTQSMNLFFEEPTHNQLTSALFYAWRNGLKTGSYYIRSRPKTIAQQFTIDPETIKRSKETLKGQKLYCSLENPEACEMCSS